MAYNEHMANRIRELLADEPDVEEKKMFSGLCFMVNGKMCICVNAAEILCRVGEEQVLAELEKDECRQMIHNGRASKAYVYVDIAGMQRAGGLEYWVKRCLEFNAVAQSSKKRK